MSFPFYVLLPAPSGELPALTAHYHGYSPNMSRSDCPAAIPPPCLFGLLGASVKERHGSPKFRRVPFDYLPRTQTPARHDRLTISLAALLASRK